MKYEWRFPYNPDLIVVAKSLKMRWNPAERCWWTEDPDVGVAIAGGNDKVIALAKARQQRQDNAVAMSRATNAEVDVPCPDNLMYLPYQKAGIVYALDRKNVLIADEMGLGKSVMSCGIINADASLKSILVVCPASLKINWQRELDKWVTRELSIGIVNGGFPDTNIVIINFDVLKNWMSQIHARAWDLLVVDEAHKLKNSKAQRTRLVLGHKEYTKKTDTPAQIVEKMKKNVPGIEARRKVFLTGTPIVNRPIELFPLLTALDPEDLGKNFFYYAKRYAGAAPTRFGWDFKGATNLDELNVKMRSKFMIRRLKVDVLKELPPKRRQIIVLPSNGLKDVVATEVRAIANHVSEMERLSVDLEIARASDADYEAIVAQLEEARDFAFAEISAARKEMAVAKIPLVTDYVKDLLEEEETKKVIVFAHHHEVVDLITEAFGDQAVKLDGRMNPKSRQESVDRFQKDESCKVFVGSIQAAGVGITLTAANVVIFAELDWVPGNVTQAEDRAHRIGQLDSVLVQHLVVDGSIDAKMAKFIVEKQDIIDRALDDVVSSIEIKNNIIVPVEKPGTASVSKSVIDMIAAKIDAPARKLIDEALMILSGSDADHAMNRNDVGFNRIDGQLGHRLVAISNKTNKQYALGLKLCWKYNKTQLGGMLAPLSSILMGDKKK